MIDVNIFNTDKTIRQSKETGARKYFCVSTDKAANPVNMMGASKCIMEMFLMRRSLDLPVSTARFANVAFSDGSLLYGFNRRMEKGQPISASMEHKDSQDLRNGTGDFINIGSGQELTMPNGTPRKLCDASRLSVLGFTPGNG
jgi:nucleoside-diphosphate-sugar epimerase